MKVLPVKVFVWGIVVSLLFFAGCREEEAGKKAAGEAAVQEPAVEKAGGDVLALVGQDKITREDVEALLARIPARRREMLKKRALDDLIEATVFAQEARARGLDKDPEAEKAVAKVRKEILARGFAQKNLDKEAEPQEEALKHFYEEHRDQFLVPEGVLVQRIVVRDAQHGDKALAALKDGTPFEEVAEKESMGHLRKGHGIEKWYYRGKTDPAVEKVAFDLEKGAVSPVIKTAKGYEVIKVLEKREPHEIPYEKAREKIRVRLFWNNKQKIIDRYYKAAGVNTHPSEPGVLARVGDEVLTEKTLAPILEKAPEKDKEKIKRRWIEYFVETSVFSKEAEKVHLEEDPDVARELRLRTDRVLAQIFRERFVAGQFHITDKDIAAYYEGHQEQFREPLKLRAKSILVKTREEAEAILKELKEKKTAFGYLAQQKSLYPHAAERAGEIGWFGKGQKDPALEETAFSLKKGDMSGIIKTKAGYEIIKLMDTKGGGIKPLDEVKQTIEMTLMMQRLDQEKQRYYKKAGVKILNSGQ